MTAHLARPGFLSLLAMALAGLSACGGVPVLEPRVDEDRFSISLDEFTRTSAGDRAVLVARPGHEDPVLVTYDHGKIRAFSSRCPRGGHRVQPKKGFLVCTRDGCSFTLSGELVRGPASDPLEKRKAYLERGRIYVPTD